MIAQGRLAPGSIPPYIRTTWQAGRPGVGGERACRPGKRVSRRDYIAVIIFR